MADELVSNPDVSSFFWADATQGMTLDQLKARRAVAAALASRARPYPKTIGEGIFSASDSLSQGFSDRQLARAEAIQRARDEAAETRARTPAAPATPAPPAGPAGSALLDLPPATAPANAFAATDPALTTAPAALTAELPPEIDAGRSALAQTAMRRPGGLQLAALNTGTMSDAGQPGLTYAGPQPAGPGAAMAARPDTEPPDPTISAGRDSLVPTMIAQAGGGRPTPAPAGPLPPRGTPVAPAPLPEPGGARINLPETVPGLRPEPKKAPSPEMLQIRSVLDAPGADKRISEGTISRLEKSYEQAKQRNDDAHSQRVEIWQKERDDILARQKAVRERTLQEPKEQLELTDAARKEAINRRFGTEENYKQLAETTNKRGETAKAIAENLPTLYEAEKMLRDRKLVTGKWTEAGPGINIPGVGNIGLPGALDVRKVVGGMFPGIGVGGGPEGESWKQQAINTEEFRAKMRPMVGAMVKKISPTGAVSNMEINQAMEALGIKGDLEQESMLKIVQNLRKEAYQSIAAHNSQMRQTFNDPRLDEKIIQHNRVEIPPDPEDVMNLKATPNSPQERARFDNIYGAGSARKILGYGR